jgi:hypothetical protein
VLIAAGSSAVEGTFFSNLERRPMSANAVCPALKIFYVQDYRLLVAFDAVSPMAFQEHKTGIEKNTSNVRRDKRDLRGREDFGLTAKIGVRDGVVHVGHRR